jgi:hypothetical protein
MMCARRSIASIGPWAILGATVPRSVPRSSVLWVPAALWLACASWQWLVLVQTPEANIRVDLMLIWPLITLVTMWAIVRAARGWWSARRRGR